MTIVNACNLEYTFLNPTISTNNISRANIFSILVLLLIQILILFLLFLSFLIENITVFSR